MTKLLLYLKHHFPIMWNWVEWINSMLFQLLHEKKFRQVSEAVTGEYSLPGFVFRPLEQEDLTALEKLLTSQSPERVAWFKPHAFGLHTLKKMHANPAFRMTGVFEGSRMVGYFFLRCFWNKKCFVGRLIDEPYEGKGIGIVMNNIMYNTAWRSGFRCLSTISKNNKLVMRSHANNKAMQVLKTLPNDYLLVEFVKPL